MSATDGGRRRDRSEPRTSLEFLVLALVRSGLDTPYDLNKDADLSVGATIPLLKRLQKAGLVVSKPAARRSLQYTITTAGERVLVKSWRRLLDTVPPDFESILRIASLAALMEADATAIRSFLSKAAEGRARSARMREQDAEQFDSESRAQPPGRGHRWLRAYSDAQRLRAEAKVLTSLAAQRDLRNKLK